MLALVIKGVDRDGQTLAYTQGDRALPSQYTAVQKVTAIPTELGTEVKPLEPGITVGGWSFSIQADETELALLMKQIKRADGYLYEDLAASALNQTVKLFPGDDLSAGDVIYVNRETIVLGTDAGGTTVTNADTGATQTYRTFTGCTRAARNSTLQKHTGQTYESSYYTDPNFSSRPVQVIEYRTSGEWVTIWTGFIFNIVLSDEAAGSTIYIELRDLFGVAASRKMNIEPWSVVLEESLVYARRQTSPSPIVYSGKFDAKNLSRFERLGRTGNGLPNKPRPMQIGDALTTGYIDNNQGISCRRLVHGLESGINFLNSPLNFVEDDTHILEVEASGYELLCWGSDFYDQEGEYYGSAQDLIGTYPDYIHHVGSLILATLCSTGYGYNGDFDILGQGWGLDIPEEYVDVDGIVAWMEANPDYTVRSLMLGAHGESWSLKEILSMTLLPYFAMLAPGGEHLATIKDISIITDADVEIDARHIKAFSEKKDRKMDDSAQVVKGTFGHFWQESSQITTRNLGRQARLWWPNDASADRSKVELNLSAFPAPDSQGRSPWVARLDYYLQWTSAEIPDYELIISREYFDSFGASHTYDITAGDKISILLDTVVWAKNSDGSRGVLVGTEGERLNSGSLKGMVKGVDTDYENNEYTLTMWLVNDPLVVEPKGIAWSFKVNTDTAIDTIIVDRYYAQGDAVPFLSAGGIRLSLYAEDLAPVDWASGIDAPTFVYSSHDADTITLLCSAGIPDAVVTQGQWLRFTARDDDRTDTGYPVSIFDEFLYLTKDSGNVDTSGGEEEGDKWV